MGAVKDVAEQEVPRSHSCHGWFRVFKGESESSPALSMSSPGVLGGLLGWVPLWRVGPGPGSSFSPDAKPLDVLEQEPPSYSSAGISLGLEPTSLGLESTSLGLESTSLGPKSLLCCSKRL